MDPQMLQMLQTQKESKISQLKAEMAWELERHRLAYRKLHERFLAPIDGMRFVVKAFQSDHLVSSFRFAALSKAFQKSAGTLFQASGRALAWVAGSSANILQKSTAATPATAASAEGLLLPQPQSQQQKSQDDASSGPLNDTSISVVDGHARSKLQEAVDKADARNKAAELRRAAMSALMSIKPDETVISPADAQVRIDSHLPLLNFSRHASFWRGGRRWLLVFWGCSYILSPRFSSSFFSIPALTIPYLFLRRPFKRRSQALVITSSKQRVTMRSQPIFEPTQFASAMTCSISVRT
jgi:hypothetical protein